MDGGKPLSYQGRHRAVATNRHQRLRTGGMIAVLAATSLLAPIVASGPVASQAVSVALPPIPTDDTSVDQVILATKRTVERLSGSLISDSALLDKARDYADDLLRATDTNIIIPDEITVNPTTPPLVINGGGPLPSPTTPPLAIDNGGAVPSPTLPSSDDEIEPLPSPTRPQIVIDDPQPYISDAEGKVRAKAQELKQTIDALIAQQGGDIDGAQLVDDAKNLTTFWTTGLLPACATVSNDLLRLRSPRAGTVTAHTDVPDEEMLTSEPAVLVGAVTGVAATLSDCLPEGSAGSDGGVTWNGQVVTQPLGDPTGVTDGGSGSTDRRGGPGPAVFENVNSKDVGRLTYGGYFDTKDGSNLYVTAYFYRPKYRDDYGDTIIAWQSGTGTVREKVNLQKFMSFIKPEKAAAARFEDYGPQGENTYESASGVIAGAEFGVEGKGVKAGVSVSRQFNVDHTVFGGDLDADGTHVFSTRGGYRNVARGHRNVSRAYSHTAAWTFPPGVSEMFTFRMEYYAYKR